MHIPAENVDGAGPFARGGEMGRLMHAHDWASTPLGPVAGWPQSLQTMVRVMLGSRYAMWLGWGPDLVFFYNDAYAGMTLGPKHPWALGRPAREVWAEIWPDIGPRAESVLRSGEATWDEGLLLYLERRGFPEESYHTFSYSPVPDDGGGVGGLLCVVTEDTERTIGERRLKTLRELAAGAAEAASSAEEACRAAAATLSANPQDVPFALLYLLDADDRAARLAGAAGLPPGAPAAPAAVDLAAPGSGWPLRAVRDSGRAEVVTDVRARLGPGPVGPFPEPPHTAAVLPLRKSGQDRLAGFLVAGASPRRPFDDDYRGFLDLLAGQLAAAVAGARAYEEERRRAEALAELDRAKTAFFSNVSHEFRTPLTLLLGPVEDALAGADGELSPALRERLQIAHRNGLRLQRLVNTLLEFSRIEAGRVRAVYEPTDLAALTADLASNFRSACARAGLQLTVECAPLPEPVFVDRQMWEKIVLNLLSNAFKFTFEGGIGVSVRPAGRAVEMRVRDTGTGIPPEEMPRLFERFHRVERARGRTHEGSGIGLALVQELVRLHGGSIAVESKVGRGTTFTLSFPLGAAHLPRDQVGGGRTLAPTAAGAGPYVEEALRWLPDPEADGAGAAPAGEPEEPALQAAAPADGERPRVLVADDNADMRRYVARLLGAHYAVETAPDGAAALLAVRRRPPDLIVSDVMMPRLDGFGLLQELRGDPRTAGVPVILLSARAGEESRVEGMQAGADDYLVKPFGARELLARVSAQLQLARLRREASESLRRSEERFELFMSHSPTTAYIKDGAGRYLYVNRQVEQQFDRPAAEWLGRTDEELFPPEEGRQIRDNDLSVLGSRRTARFLEASTRPDGLHHYLSFKFPLQDRGGRWLLAGMSIDVTEQERTQRALREAETRFRAVFNQQLQFMAILSPDGTVIEANDTCFRGTGVAREAVLGRPFWEAPWWAGLPAMQERWRRLAAEALLTGEPALAEVDYRMADGAERHATAVITGLRDEAGQVTMIVVEGRDDTDRRRAEEALRRSEQRWRTMAEALPNLLWTALPDGRCDWLSRQWGRYAGLPEAEFLGLGWLERVVHPDDRERTLACWRSACAGRGDYDLAYRIRRHDGAYRWFQTRGVPLRDDRGRIVYWFGTCTDIEDVKRAEERERVLLERTVAATAKFEAVFNQSGIFAGILDLQGRLLEVNELALKACGSTREEVLGRPFWDTPWWRGAEEVRERIRAATRQACGGAPFREVLRYWVGDGSERVVDFAMHPIRDPAGAVIFLHPTGIDITERVRAAEALREADRRKDEFLATLAHELRNPLAPIRNGLEVLRLAGGDAGMAERARAMMERQLGQMVHLVDDLLDLSRISRGRIELRRERVDLAEAVQRAVETSRPHLERAGHALTIDAPPAPIWVEADLTRLAQALANLLNNAAKYTERGGRVRLTARRDGEDAVVAVRDDGIGIPQEMLPYVFDMFTRVDRNPQRAQSGLGIGLSIVKRLVEMHGGSVEARSEGHGRGSEFVVRLPAVPAAAPRPEGDAAPPAPGRRRVLVVDDNRDAAMSLAMMLELMGHEARTAHDGLEALALAPAFRPDVVLLDIGMPRLNGYDAARAMREQPWGRGLVLVALTGWGQEDDRRRSQAAGFDHHLTKPVDPAGLQQLLAGAPPPAAGA